MGNFDVRTTLETLTGERSRALKVVAKLDKAIAVIRELAGSSSTLNGHSRKRTLSAAARRKIAKAQKLRWAKFRKAQGSKA